MGHDRGLVFGHMLYGPGGILGADPEARVHRGPAKMPWREAPSKIRDPQTGLLRELARRGKTLPIAGTHVMSTRYFKMQALDVLANPNLGRITRARLLDMVREACAQWRKNMLAGTLDLAPGSDLSTPRNQARIARQLTYEGRPCGRCGGTTRYASAGGCVPCVRARTKRREQIHGR